MPQSIIGLEIHLQLNTRTKMFCSCQNDSSEKEPNLNICPICLGYPGVLPVINKEAVKKTILMGLALNSKIASFSKFDRKNYFYPDLPKGYQISQYDSPLCERGYLEISSFDEKIEAKKSQISTSSSSDYCRESSIRHFTNQEILDKVGTNPIRQLRWPSEDQIPNSKFNSKFIRIRRVHLEEDAAKLIHSNEDDCSLIDFNRGGTPLMEIVTEPDLKSIEETKIFLQNIQQIVRYLEISEADMENGQMRCDANINLFLDSGKKTSRVEIKNLNSFRAIERALNYEIKRQEDMSNQGEDVVQETRKWDDQKQKTISMRSKEDVEDYRYFPEPDLPPLFPNQLFDLEKLKKFLPELPKEKKERFKKEYDFSENDAEILIRDRYFASFFEETISEIRTWLFSLEENKDVKEKFSSFFSPDFLKRKKETWESEKNILIKLTSDWLINRLSKILSDKNISIKEKKITSENFAEFILLLHQKIISSSIGQDILKEMVEKKADPTAIILEKNLVQINSEEELQEKIEEVIKENPKPIEDFKKGKTKALMFLVGQVMKKTKGRAEPKIVEKILKEKIQT